jgi:hypothetical protein
MNPISWTDTSDAWRSSRRFSIEAPAYVTVGASEHLQISCQHCAPCLDTSVFSSGQIRAPLDFWANPQSAFSQWQACWQDDAVLVQVPVASVERVSSSSGGAVSVNSGVLGGTLGQNTVTNTGSGPMTILGSLPSSAQNSIENSGSGPVSFLGALGRAVLHNSGSGPIRVVGANSDNVQARITGSGNITFADVGALDYTLTGSGSIECLHPAARLSGHRTGSGQVGRSCSL